MKDPDIPKKLFEKYLQNTCTPGEVRQLLDYFLHADDAEQGLLELMRQQLEAPAPHAEQDPDIQAKLQHALAHIRSRIGIGQPTKRIRMGRWIYAAAAILVVGITITLYFSKMRNLGQNPKISLAEIRPGYNQATLTLANGHKIHLDSAQGGITVSNGAIKYQNGEAVSGFTLSTAERQIPDYLQTGTANGNDLLLLSTPRGGQYQIILSDGTKVWLNAASTLKYPGKFTGNKREVEIEGEAYFAVAKSKRLLRTGQVGEADPFVVKTNGQSITVLGTEFNVSAYRNAGFTKTTLISGAVQVSLTDIAVPDCQLRLAPGEQARLEKGQLQKNKVDVDMATSWKSGLFDFTGKKLPEIMDELERWYNITVSYEGTIPDNTYYGNIYRNYSLDKVLKIFENAQIKFRMEKGNRLIISQTH